MTNEQKVIEAARAWLKRIDDCYPGGGPLIGRPERERLRYALDSLDVAASGPDDSGWVLLEPGVLILPPTALSIHWDGIESFMVRWRDSNIGACVTLLSAKDYARRHLRQFMEMGIEDGHAAD